jgi:hypothetical protein
MSGAEFALVAVAASTALAATQTVMQASNQAKMARYNAQVAEQNAAAAQRQAEADAARQERQVQRQLAKRRTAVSAGGVSLEGSPLDLMEDLAMEGQLDVLGIRQRGLSDARQFSISASRSQFEARTAMQEGLLGAGRQVTSGLADMGGRYDQIVKSRKNDIAAPRVVRSNTMSQPFGADPE